MLGNENKAILREIFPKTQNYKDMKIYGAGISGLLAGAMFQTAEIFEASSPNRGQHKALLRFRTSAVGDAVGIDFRKVKVHKGLWHDGRFVQPNLQLANYYSKKVVGKILDRSVWNLDPCERFVAPEDFVQQLQERCAGRIHWSHEINRKELLNERGPVISTLPMELMVGMLANELPYDFIKEAPKFSRASINVERWRVPNADVFQTVYYADPSLDVYRASITGDTLIVESVEGRDQEASEVVFQSFGLTIHDVVLMDRNRQNYGKISPVEDAWRKQFIFWLSHERNIFSLGRFGTWRNILLDDVIKDVSVLKKLIGTSGYDRMKASSK